MKAERMIAIKRQTLGKTHEGLREETRTLILSAAQALFTEIGYVKSTMQLISAKAGISRSSLYRHFDTKWHVARALMDAFWPSWVELWEICPIDDATTIPRLVEWLEIILSELRQSKNFILLLQEIMSVEDEAGDLSVAVLDQILEIIGNKHSVFLGNAKRTSEQYFFDQIFINQLNYFFYVSLRSSWYAEHSKPSLKAMALHMLRFVEMRRVMLHERPDAYVANVRT
jgi:AcrR family transcriptional regulator